MEPWSPEQLSTMDHHRAYTGKGCNGTARGSRGGSVIEVQASALNNNIAVPRRMNFDSLSMKFIAHRCRVVKLQRLRICERLRVLHRASVNHIADRKLTDLSADRSRNVAHLNDLLRDMERTGVGSNLLSDSL